MKGTKMDSPIGMYSYKTNPLPQPKRTPSNVGTGMNPDKNKVDKLQKKAYNEKDSLRGKTGM